MGKFFKKVLRNIEVSRTKSALSQMTDRQLKDIGIARGEIHSVAHTLAGA